MSGSDRRHLLVELELDESLFGRRARRQASVVELPVGRHRPQSASAVRRSTAADVAQRTTSPYKLQQRVLSSRSRRALDADADADRVDARRESRFSSSAELIADAIRQNMAARQSVLLDLDSALSLPVATSRGSLSSQTIKLLNRLRSLTLSIVEMVQFFESQPAPALTSGWTAMRHEFTQYLLRVAASDVDALVRFPALTTAFDLLGVSVVRNPLLDGVTLDASELLLCSCQRLNAATAASPTSSSLTQLVLHRLEAFALRVRREFPSWQVLPHDRVAAALLVLLDLETKHNASRLLPSYLRPEGSSFRGEGASRRASLAWANAEELQVEEEDQELYRGVDKRRMRPLKSTIGVHPVAMGAAADVDMGTGTGADVDVAQPKPQVSPQRSSKKSKTAPFDRHATIASLSPVVNQSSCLQKVAEPKIAHRDESREPTLPSPAKVITVDASTTTTTVNAAVSTLCSTTQTSARVERVDASTLAVPEPTPTSSPRLPPLRLAEISVPEPSPPPTPSSRVSQPSLEPAPTAEEEIQSDCERPPTSRPQPELVETCVDPDEDDGFETFDASSILAQIAGVVQSLPQFDCAQDSSTIEVSSDPPTPVPVDADSRPLSPLDPPLVLSSTAEPDDARPTEQEDTPAPSSPRSPFPLQLLSIQEPAAERPASPPLSSPRSSPQSSPSSPDLARILALCRDVQLAAVDLTQRLLGESLPSLLHSPSSATHAPPRAPLSTRYLESELKMLRRYVRSWRSVVLETRFAVESLRLRNAERRVVRFLWRCHQRWTQARVAAIDRRRARAASCLQHAWRGVIERRRQRQASDAFHRQHRAFARCRFFLRLQRRRRRRASAQRTLATWWRRLQRARRARQQRRLAQERERERRDRAALRLQNVMSEHTLRTQLARARAAADELQERHATRLREEQQRREQLETLRRQELRDMQRRWQDADSERQRLEHEQRRLLARHARADARQRRRDAARTIAQFLELSVLRRRLATAQQRCAATERVVQTLETQQLQRHAQHARASAERALQASVLRWQVTRARASQRRLESERETQRARQARERIQRFLVQHVVARNERSRWRQRLQDARVALARQTIGAFALHVALERRLARQQAEARALAAALEREKQEALARERALAESRLQTQRREQLGTTLQLWVQSHWRRRRQERAREAQARADAEARERAAMAASDAEQRALNAAAAAAALASQQQQQVRLQVRQNLLQLQRRKSELKTQQLHQKQQLTQRRELFQQPEQERETRGRRVHRVLSESVTDVQHSRRLAAVEHKQQQLQQQQQQHQQLQQQQEQERQRQLQQQQQQQTRSRALVAETLLATKFLAEECSVDALKRAVAGVRRLLELVATASTVRRLRIRRIERRCVARWREMVATRRCVVEITQHALWSAPVPSNESQKEDEAEKQQQRRLSEERRRALRLYELRCNACARRVQRCWRAWRLRLRRHRRQQVKAEEDRLVTTMKMARYASSKRLLVEKKDEEEEMVVETTMTVATDKMETKEKETEAASPETQETETENDALAPETPPPTETETSRDLSTPSAPVTSPERQEETVAMPQEEEEEDDARSRQQHASTKLQHWWRRSRSRARLHVRVVHSDGVAYALSFAGGRAALSSAGVRFRLDRHATRHLLLVMTADDACHPPSERLRVVHELVADVAAVALPCASSSSSSSSSYVHTVDVDEMELPRFALVSRQLAKTRSIYRRKLLLDARASATHRDSALQQLSTTGPLTVFDAVESGSVADAQFLLRQGADLSVREPVAARTALHMLAFCGERVALRVEMLEFLVQRAGLSLHALDAHGESPVVLFAANGQLELLARALQQLGGDWRSPAHARTALHAACEQDHAEVAAALHAMVMDSKRPPPPSSSSEEDEDAMMQRLRELHRRDRHGRTPLHVLVERGFVESARQLLAAEPQRARRRLLLLALEDDGGGAPLARAVSRCHLEMVETLLQALAGDGGDGGGPPRLDDRRDARGRGLLHHAVLAADSRSPAAAADDDVLDLLSLLADAGVELETADERGDTALHYAALSGRTAVLRHLLALGADAHARNSDLESPAQLAAAHGHLDCERLLLASVSASSSLGLLGTTPSAASYYHPSAAATAAATRKPEAFYWDELHREVQLVDESGHFSSEEEEDEGDEDH